jgi:hypothetical protein
MGWATFWAIFTQTHLVTRRPILNFAHRSELGPQGWTLSPGGEVIPWGWNSLYGLNEGVNIPPWGQISPRGPSSPLGVRVKLRMAFWVTMTWRWRPDLAATSPWQSPVMQFRACLRGPGLSFKTCRLVAGVDLMWIVSTWVYLQGRSLAHRVEVVPEGLSLTPSFTPGENTLYILFRRIVGKQMNFTSRGQGVWSAMKNQLFSLRKLPCDWEVRGHCMCKEMLVIPVNRVVE